MRFLQIPVDSQDNRRDSESVSDPSYHGDCVGVSKSQGKRIERCGIDFICPVCSNDINFVIVPEGSPHLL